MKLTKLLIHMCTKTNNQCTHCKYFTMTMKIDAFNSCIHSITAVINDEDDNISLMTVPVGVATTPKNASAICNYHPRFSIHCMHSHIHTNRTDNNASCTLSIVDCLRFFYFLPRVFFLAFRGVIVRKLMLKNRRKLC